MTQDEVLTEIRIYIAKNFNGKDKLFAEHIGVSKSAVSIVLRKIRPPTEKILNAIGYKKIEKVEYVKK